MFIEGLRVDMMIKKLKRILLSLILLVCFLPAWSEDIHDAVIKGGIILVKNLLEKNPKLVNTRGKLERTPLHLAAQEGHQELVELLLDKGADIDARDKYRCTPLHLATSEGHQGVVQLLLAKGANINTRDIKGNTPLCMAIQFERKNVAQLLINKGADVNISENFDRSPLYWAANRGYKDLVGLLIAKGAYINVRSKMGMSAIHTAIICGHSDIVELLIKKGADINAEDSHFDTTPIHLAAWTGRSTIIELLLLNGADINIKNKHGETPLHIASKRDQINIAPLLIEKGAAINVKDNYGRTPLQMAVLRGHNDFANFFFNKGENVNEREPHFGRSLLHLASIKGYKKIVAFLINRGANINDQDDKGFTPLRYAALYGHKKLAKLLIEKGAKELKGCMEKNYSNSLFLKKKLKEKEAFLWYLGRHGWGIKTKTHFLVFDYWDSFKNPTEPSLSNGHIIPSEIKDCKILVFVSFEYIDIPEPKRSSLVVYEWKKQIQDIAYIQGFPPRISPKHIYVAPGEIKKINNVEIISIKTSSKGVGFLVKVDGLVLFHSDFHEEGIVAFKKEIHSLAEHIKNCDIVFLPVFKYIYGKDIAPPGIEYTIKKIHPNALFPMSPEGKEYLSREFARKAAKKRFKTKIYWADNRGDRFFYQEGKIEN